MLVVAGILYLLLTNLGSEDASVDSSSALSENTTNTGSDTSQSQQTKEYLRIAAMGDMLPHETLNHRAQVSGSTYDYLQFLDQVSTKLDGSDIVFCNQESPSAGEAFGISGYPSFNAPQKFSQDLNEFGCNVINLANNHVADKGQAAINETLTIWDSLDVLAVAGANRSKAQQDTISYFEHSGKKFAFIAFTDLSNNTAIDGYSINMFSAELTSALAKEASANADYVIASAHWGIEDSPSVSDSQRNWATLLANNGVDLVLGTGPHVLQPVEKIGDTIVFYSLGNFLSTQLTIEQLTGGIAYIDIPISGGEPKLSFVPTYMGYTWTAEQELAQDLLSRDDLDVYPLSEAADQIERSLFETTVQEQISRITNLLNSSAEVQILP